MGIREEIRLRPAGTPVTEEGAKLNSMNRLINFVKGKYDLRRNEVTALVEARSHETSDPFRPVNENDIYVELKVQGHRATMVDIIALLNSEYIPTYNPFLDYFESLPDPVEGTIERFASYVKALQQEQFVNHFKKMLVRTTAGALNPKEFNKQCFTLVSRTQGNGKTTWCRYLVPPALLNYYTENLPPDKDGQIALSQNFIIGLDELSVLSRFELNHLKASFSRSSVTVRHPYARKQTTEPRRASFIASTNEDGFLTDLTGSVRWLCFYVYSINFDYESIPIDQVWSEAYHLYKSGFQYNLTAPEIRENEERNEQYQVISPEIEYIQKYCRPGSMDNGHQFFTATEIRDLIMDRTDRRADLKSPDKIGKAMARLGFERVAKKINGETRRGYYVECL